MNSKKLTLTFLQSDTPVFFWLSYSKGFKFNLKDFYIYIFLMLNLCEEQIKIKQKKKSDRN